MHDSEKPDVLSKEKPNVEDSHTAPELPDDALADIDIPVDLHEEEVSSIDTAEDSKENETAESKDSQESGEDEIGPVADEPPQKPGKLKRFFKGYWHHKKWTILLTVLIIGAAVFAIPKTRYSLLALEMQRSFTVKVIDSKTNTPVSGANVTIAGKKVMTNSDGVATLQAKVGSRNVAISKQYYKGLSEGVFVGISTNHNAVTVSLAATGRQVPVSVIDALTGAHIANAQITVLNTEAKTNANGVATIVLPTSATTYAAAITASGYNSTKAQITVTSKVISSNIFSVTPTGKVYFLSNLSGTIDVDSANLDGSDRQTVLAGTGSEDVNNTLLYQTSDWKYLALISRRDGGNYDKLFLINTSNNQETLINGTAATYQAIGWSGHDFVYEVTNPAVQAWQPGQYVLKSYDADTGKTVILDQTTASGSASNYTEQVLDNGSTELVNGTVVYAKSWTTNSNSSTSENDQILTVNPDGTDKTILKSFPVNAASYGYISAVSYNPAVTYFAVEDDAGTTYYVYQNGNLTQSNTITSSSFYGAQYPSYITSPSGNSTFWSATRDGQNTLLIGDATGSNGKAIDSLTSYTAYGWYTDNYVLVSKGGNTLYIMPVGGGKVTKVADYFQ